MRNCDDLKQIKDMQRTCSWILSLYKHLCFLEIDGKKNTDDYKNTLEQLKNAIDEEKKIYSVAKLDSNPDKVHDWFYNLISDDFLSNFANIISLDYSDSVIRRIVTTLSLSYVNNISLLKKIMDDEENGASIIIKGLFSDKEIEKSLFNSEELKKAFQSDEIFLFLLFLDRFIKNDRYSFLRSKLIACKYHISFLYKQVEEIMIRDNFKIDDRFYLRYNFIADLLGADSFMKSSIKDSLSVGAVSMNIQALLDMCDSDYNDDNKRVSSILRECFMRANFLFLDEKTIIDLNDAFHEYIESDDYLATHKNNEISENIVMSCFKKVGKDKSRVRFISLCK